MIDTLQSRSTETDAKVHKLVGPLDRSKVARRTDLKTWAKWSDQAKGLILPVIQHACNSPFVGAGRPHGIDSFFGTTP